MTMKAARSARSLRAHPTFATTLWPWLRILAALIVIAAVVAQLGASIAKAEELGRDVGTVVANFLSFFTVLSNAMSAAVLCWAGVHSLIDKGEGAQPRSLSIALACVTTYMVVTGLVYNALLRNEALPQGSAPLVRGPLIVSPLTGERPWYPYPFLNPFTVGGWGWVLVYVAVTAAVVLAVGLLVVAWTRRDSALSKRDATVSER
ncbi:uncharacterized membrane protein YidH (DUF202 family) [Agromyces terreus]|uniref:Uncharacterized membrane protein YidH (DUF202 family) n=1 Tax=Agromyces terreus TaxID=424795 RepID=A0A9X2KDD4_9MICO|nr:Pr6Pr family membrane protein [Agromyces terreus]MCP2372311.1 uncharacterized membrane protein YidH (DUF202 family) [Agromyces terreus]